VIKHRGITAIDQLSTLGLNKQEEPYQAIPRNKTTEIIYKK